MSRRFFAFTSQEFHFHHLLNLFVLTSVMIKLPRLNEVAKIMPQIVIKLLNFYRYLYAASISLFYIVTKFIYLVDKFCNKSWIPFIKFYKSITLKFRPVSVLISPCPLYLRSAPVIVQGYL